MIIRVLKKCKFVFTQIAPMKLSLVVLMALVVTAVACNKDKFQTLSLHWTAPTRKVMYRIRSY
jgi:hypothetical protein